MASNVIEHGVETLAPGLGERQWAAAAHVAALLAALATSWVAGIAGALGALVVWLLVRDKHAFAAEHAREALNFNLSMFIYAALLTVLVVFTLGIGLIVALPMWLILAVTWVVCTLVAAFRAYDGQPYRYPLSIRLFG
ncbi:MAG: DUF4870 domain-containing protein [Lysobacteraceae bacterium]|nr:MAG: DUF4870 domain-containing protein [Xanthomonadaceae bacterium]